MDKSLLSEDADVEGMITSKEELNVDDRSDTITEENEEICSLDDPSKLFARATEDVPKTVEYLGLLSTADVNGKLAEEVCSLEGNDTVK